ncbi:MAG: DNA gyrase inhibitor YacG [Betaproteobacteria bacterium]
MSVVACPCCGKPVEWTSASRWRPFCSERCKMIDLGAWASEAYRVPDAMPTDVEGPETAAGEDPRDRGMSS